MRFTLPAFPDYLPLDVVRRNLIEAERFTEAQKLSDVVRLPSEPESDAQIVARRERKVAEMRSA